jgi:acid phosphatase (class A)
MRKQILFAAVASLVAGCASTPDASSGAPRQAGYLTAEQLPDSARLLPPPPAAGSAAQASDEELNRRAATLRGTARWDLAAMDAAVSYPQALGIFNCALGFEVSLERTPRLARLMRTSGGDAARSTGAAKNLYMRTRPYAQHGESTCYPEHEQVLRTNGSYPSGHTASGWATALVLTELVPDRANELLARGRAFGESRMICNYHWHSDVAQARDIASSTVARLHAVPEFQQDLEAARKEVAAARERDSGPGRDCEAEARALAQVIPAAQ